MILQEPWEDMVTALCNRLLWQYKDDPKYRHEPLKRFPRGWRRAINNWCKIYRQEQKQGLLLASYIFWMYGKNFSELEIFLLMEDALLMAQKVEI